MKTKVPQTGSLVELNQSISQFYMCYYIKRLIDLIQLYQQIPARQYGRCQNQHSELPATTAGFGFSLSHTSLLFNVRLVRIVELDVLWSMSWLM